MKFSRWLFLIAGIYGLLVLTPMLFLERQIGEQAPPTITHPEYFYGFIGVALAWQVLFVILSRDPLRYRPLILPAILEKLAFGITCVVLLAQGRLAAQMAAGGFVDLLLAALFTWSYVLLGRAPSAH